MRCQEHQFELGVRYSIPENLELKMCKTGFHSCNTLLQVTEFYPPTDSRYFEVEVEDTISGDNKNVSRHITLIRELTFNEVMRLLNFKKDGSLLGPEDDQTNLGFYNHGNNNRGNHNVGNFNHGNDNYGNSNYGNFNRGNNNHGNSNYGNSNYGNSNH